MWFNPSELLTQTKKPPANFANLANFKSNDLQNADKISITVEVNTETSTTEISRISKISNGLSVADSEKLLAYLAAIDETDPEMIHELLNECAINPDTLEGALQWADKVLAVQAQRQQSIITCRGCLHFQCYNDHGGGAGSCGAGVMPCGICWWSETRHECAKYRVLEVKNEQ